MRCELFNYVEAMLRSPKPKNSPVLSMLLCYFMVGVSCYFGIAAMNFVALWLAFMAGFVYIVGLMCGSSYFNNKPNLVSQMPLSPKKSLLYRFVSVLIIFLMLVVFIMLFILVIVLITSGIVLIIDAVNSAGTPPTDVPAGDEGIGMMTPMGVHGGIFAAAFFVFMYGMGMLIGFIKDRKIKTAVVVCQSVLVLGGMVLMRNPFMQESYDKMAVPWLCTALCIAAALAALGMAVYMGIRQYNKSY